MAAHQLISIPASHYCERARWALDYAGIECVEQKWIPMLHYLGTLPTSGTRTVPVLKCPATSKRKARVLVDSVDIVQYAHEHMQEAGNTAARTGAPSVPTLSPLYPSDPDELQEVVRLEERFSLRLGVWTRVVAYHHLFRHRDRALDVLARRQSRPPALAGWQAAALRAGFGLVRTAIVRGFRADERGAAACLSRIRELFREVDELLQRGGGEYLVGGRFSAADVTFAAMAAVVLMPEQYGAYLPPLEAWPADFPGWELRDTPAGRHVMRLYERHRNVDGWGRPSPSWKAAAAGAAVIPAAGVREPGLVAEAAGAPELWAKL